MDGASVTNEGRQGACRATGASGSIDPRRSAPLRTAVRTLRERDALPASEASAEGLRPALHRTRLLIQLPGLGGRANHFFARSCRDGTRPRHKTQNGGHLPERLDVRKDAFDDAGMGGVLRVLLGADSSAATLLRMRID